VDEGEHQPTGAERLLESGADLAQEPILPEAPKDLTARAANGFAWSLAGFFFIQLGSFATYTVAANILAPAGAGLVGALLTIVFWIDVFLDTGLGASVVYEQEEGHTHRISVAFTLTTMMTVVATAVVVAAAPLIAGFFGAQHYVGLFRLVALVVLFRGMNQVPAATLRRDMDFRKSMFSSSAQAITRFVVAVWLLKTGHGVLGMLIGVIASEFIGTFLTWVLVRFKPRFRWDRAVAGEMFRYGLPVFGSTLLGMLWLNSDYLIVGHHDGAKSKPYGNYYAAFQMPTLILGSFYNIFSTVAFPMYSAARDVGPDKLRQASLRSLKLLTLVGFTASVGLAVVARDFFHVLYPKFTGAVEPMEILCIAGGFVGIGFASGDLYNAIGKPKMGLLFNAIGTPILIIGFIIAVPHGIVAVATVHVTVMIPYSFIRIEVANRLVGTTWAQSLRAMLPAFSAVVGILAATLPIRLLVGPGPFTLIAIIAAGIAGAVVGVAIGDRSTFAELKELVFKAIGR
jgi:PST family polysaccharide transporter